MIASLWRSTELLSAASSSTRTSPLRSAKYAVRSFTSWVTDFPSSAGILKNTVRLLLESFLASSERRALWRESAFLSSSSISGLSLDVASLDRSLNFPSRIPSASFFLNPAVTSVRQSSRDTPA